MGQEPDHQLNGSIEELKKTAGDNEALQNQINEMQTAHTAEVAALNQKLSDQAMTTRRMASLLA